MFERNTSESFRNYLFPKGNWDLAYIVFPGRNETIEIDYVTKEYKIRSGTRGGATVWDPDDKDCAKLATAFALSQLERIGEVVIAGIRAIEYTGKRSSTHRLTVALAPSLGCLQMRNVDRDYNRLGLPTSFYQSEVVSVQIGEPDPSVFQIPEDFHPKR